MPSAGDVATLLGAATAAVSALAAARSGSRSGKAEASAKATTAQVEAQNATLAGLRNLVDDLQEQLQLERDARKALQVQLSECQASEAELRAELRVVQREQAADRPRRRRPPASG